MILIYDIIEVPNLGLQLDLGVCESNKVMLRDAIILECTVSTANMGNTTLGPDMSLWGIPRKK